ncbi:hypothetical protein NVP1081O_157 [Vibrio phage 1.081.O._10N.286.52.C2]|nr:hypothetical protein NVP1081O_157 [Vibrio phage 1.081.O._10N.286.52.C2]
MIDDNSSVETKQLLKSEKNMTSINTVKQLIVADDAAIVNQSEFRIAFAFAFGCMTESDRTVFVDIHKPLLVEYFCPSYCTSDEVVLSSDAVLDAIAYIKECLTIHDYALLKTDFQFNIAQLTGEFNEV